MKTLITYFSFSGNNEMLALELRKLLNCEILKIREVKKRTGFSIFMDFVFNRTPKIEGHGQNIREYEHIVLVAPIWASKIASPLRSFLLLERSNIRSYSFITVCSGAPDQKLKIEAELTSLIGIQPVITTELWINNLLPEGKKNKVRYVSSYRLEPQDLSLFAADIGNHAKMTSDLLYQH